MQRPVGPWEDVLAAAVVDPEVFKDPDRALEFVFAQIAQQYRDSHKDVTTDEVEYSENDESDVGPNVMLSAAYDLAWKEMIKRFVLRGEPLPEGLDRVVPPAHLRQLQDAVKTLRGEPTAAPDKTIESHAELWLKKQQALAAAGQMTASRVANNRTCLEHFKIFLGPQSAAEGINGQLLEAFYLYCAGRIRRDGGAGGWSVAYAKDVFSVARSFVRWAWEQGACELPRNIDMKAKFGSPMKAVKTWDVADFKRAVEAAPGKLRLALLLMANCGMTQKDVSDLRDAEVDWVKGRVIRRRSKTATRENAPVVNYNLWPLTFELLQKYRSGQDRVLLTERGQPFVRIHLNATGRQVKADGFASNFVHLKKRLKLTHPLKELRKLGASIIGTHKHYGPLVHYFLGHSPRTVADRHYVIPPPELFDEAVLWLGQQLGQVPAATGSPGK